MEKISSTDSQPQQNGKMEDFPEQGVPDNSPELELKRLYSIVPECILEVARNLHELGLVSESFFAVVSRYWDKIQPKLREDRDKLFSYEALMLMTRQYLLGIEDANGDVVPMERPQHMFMRIALSIHLTISDSEKDLEDALETYEYLSLHKMTHASPVFFNAGSKRQQMASCFLLGAMDSVDSVYSTLNNMANIAANSGGIGLHLSNIRAADSKIKGGISKSGGIIPYCKVVETMCHHINQGGKRGASVAVYLEPWHADIVDFCELKSNVGDDNKRARDLFNALWIPDLFMERVARKQDWSLMTESECPGLSDKYGKEFEELYTKYEKEGKYVRVVRARELFTTIMKSIVETGGPYILFKDTANRRSNQNNLGTIKSSNLCAEIIQYSDHKEHAVCNLASLALPSYVYGRKNDKFDVVSLGEATRILVRNLNKTIDFMFYPTEGSKLSNERHRPIGIGVQGLSDMYNKMKLEYDSPEARELNRKIFETIYFNALSESCELSKRMASPSDPQAGAYKSFHGSQFSRGIVQFHHYAPKDVSLFYNWDGLLEDIKKYGVRNSQLTAVMPTASTSYLFGNSESIEVPISNVYKRKTKYGEHLMINKYLVKDLCDLGLWTEEMRSELLMYNGSVQNIKEIPDNIKRIYKTPFEIGWVPMLQQAIDRGAFIDQSQSFNVIMKNSSLKQLYESLSAAWRGGMKTGLYYCRLPPAVNTIRFGIDVDLEKKLRGAKDSVDLISNNYEISCIGCSS